MPLRILSYFQWRLHHTYDSEGNRNPAVQLYERTELYEKYKHFFKGIE